MVRNRIAILRKQNGLNQRELGDKLGVVQATVSAWETGRNEPDNETLQRVADLFRVNFAYVAGYEDTKKHRPLTDEEAAEREERRRVQEISRRESYEESGLTQEEIDDIIENEQRMDFEEHGEGLYYEAYQFNKACEYMSADQRERALSALEVLFPKAFQSSYNPD